MSSNYLFYFEPFVREELRSGPFTSKPFSPETLIQSAAEVADLFSRPSGDFNEMISQVACGSALCDILL